MTSPAPLREALRDPFSEGDLARLWPAIEARRARGRRLFAGASVLVMAGAAAATAFALAVPPRASASRLGPLHLATGAAVRPLDGAAGAPVVTSCSTSAWPLNTRRAQRRTRATRSTSRRRSRLRCA